MSDFNKVILTGRLTKDIELTFTQGGKALAKGAIAVNRKFGEKEQTSFVDFIAWEKSGEILTEYTSKGSKVLLEGRLEQDTWEKDGKKFSKLYLVVVEFQFLERKNNE